MTALEDSDDQCSEEESEKVSLTLSKRVYTFANLIWCVFHNQEHLSLNVKDVDVKDEVNHPRKRFKLDSSASSHQKIQKKKKEEPPLPQPFQLPRNYPKSVEEGIESGNLTGKARTKFISSVAAAIFRFKSYPTKDEHEHVSRQIVQAYPFMTGGGRYVSSMHFL